MEVIGLIAMVLIALSIFLFANAKKKKKEAEKNDLYSGNPTPRSNANQYQQTGSRSGTSPSVRGSSSTARASSSDRRNDDNNNGYDLMNPTNPASPLYLYDDEPSKSTHSVSSHRHSNDDYSPSSKSYDSTPSKSYGGYDGGGGGWSGGGGDSGGSSGGDGGGGGGGD